MNPPRLVITDALGRRAVPCDKPVVTIGRRADSDVRLSGSGVSRAHAEIVAEDGAYRLRDCESRYGTFVNGERITDHVLVRGDRIALGQADGTEIVFTTAEETLSQTQSAAAMVSEIRQVAALLEGLRALGSGRVLEDVLTLVLDAAIEVTGAERAFIMLADPNGQLEFKQARARGKLTLPGRTFATSRKIPEGVFATGQDAIVEDLLDAGVAVEHLGTVALGIRYVLCTPLRLVRYVERAEDRGDDKAIGVLYVDSRERGALRSDQAQSALHTLSNEAAVAIENARLYRQALERAKIEQELKVAADIQQSLLPLPDRRGGYFTISGVSVPCRAVGGDFFDYVDLSTGQFGFIVGDVTGKGPPAALLSAALLGMFGSEATYQSGAAAVLSRLNLGLFRRNVDGRFVTTFYGVLGADGAFTYSNGGHNPPFLVSADGVRRLDKGGLVLGLFETAPFEEETVRLDRGDFVVAFSDGVTEAFNEVDEDFTDDRLLASITAHRVKAPKDMLAAMLEDVRAFCGHATQSDDVTMVVLRYEGGEPSPSANAS
jgi:serine phosphatase RsbU (regulator of sigma subunit)/pSer/pThr/pTyr-binding forkhead associated (FHA) protein